MQCAQSNVRRTKVAERSAKEVEKHLFSYHNGRMVEWYISTLENGVRNLYHNSTLIPESHQITIFKVFKKYRK